MRGTFNITKAKDETEPKFLTEPPPEYFTDTSVRKEWDRLAAILRRNGLLTEVDGEALIKYCELYIMWKDASAKVRRDGVCLKGKYGPVQHPAFKAVIMLGAQIKTLLCEFGMTPASRTRVRVKEEDKTKSEEETLFD
jgi:P27 family predicted phage terminase small subunit